MARKKIPGWRMSVAKARKKWAAVRSAAMSGDPIKMEQAVSEFEPIAEAAIETWSKSDQHVQHSRA